MVIQRDPCQSPRAVERDLSAMAGRLHDVLVVGGGVGGLCIARDAAKRGLSVALVERDDFAHATSAASSKLIHGGLRYLKTYEFGLVRESLRERRIWESIAPHLVYPLPFLLPNYRTPESSKRWLVRAGLTLYDLLGYDRNRLEDEDRKLPGYRALSAQEALARVPGLSSESLIGALEYWDCQMFAPERLALESGLDAAKHGAHLANWAQVDSFIIEDSRVAGARISDRVSGASVEVKAKVVVNATGPWADRILGTIAGTTTPTIVRSKGIHVITRSLTDDVAVAFESKGGHFFILPWRGHSLIGTSDVVFKGDPDSFAVTEEDIQDFLDVINAGFPSAGLTRADVVHFYGGMRPLVESAPGDNAYSASRRAEVVDHASEGGAPNLLSALGGKWTTARAVAEQVVDMVGTKLGIQLPPCATHHDALPGGGFGTWADFVAAQAKRYPKLHRDVIENLARNYGQRMNDVMAIVEADPTQGEPLAPQRLELRAQVVFAVRHEMARTLADVVFRRTGLGTLGDPGPAALEATAQSMADELGWNATQRKAELESLRSHFTPARA